jgi:Fur family peroxide stress response transcriptional regulator
MKKEAHKRYQAVVDKLKEGRHKLTPQRLAIISILTGNEDHPSVEDICRQLQKRFPGISQATVYRNIMLIKSLGEVLEIGFAAGSSRYDGRNPRPHPHVVCLKCHKIIDPQLDGLRDITKKIAEKSGFEIVTYRLDFFGLCPDCRDTG